MGATIVDVVRFAASLGYADVQLVTHGSNYSADMAPGMVSQLIDLFPVAIKRSYVIIMMCFVTRCKRVTP